MKMLNRCFSHVFDVLNHNLYGDASARPIHNIQCRIKKKQSIEEKLQRKGKEPTVMNAKDYLQDIAGVRVICYFVDDIYNLTEILKSQSDLIVNQRTGLHWKSEAKMDIGAIM